METFSRNPSRDFPSFHPSRLARWTHVVISKVGSGEEPGCLWHSRSTEKGGLWKQNGGSVTEQGGKRNEASNWKYCYIFKNIFTKDNLKHERKQQQISRFFPPISTVIILWTVFICHYSSFHLLENLKTSQTHTDVKWSTYAENLLHTWAKIQGRKKLLHKLEIRKE